MKKFTLFLFLVISLGQLTGEVLEIKPLSAGLKLLLMPSLLMYYWSYVPQSAPTTINRGIMFALILSYFGDAFLLFASRNELFFMLGLASFLIAHMAYIFVFLHINGIKRGNLYKNPSYIIPVILLYAVLMWILVPYVPSPLTFPILIYGAVICTMLLSTINIFNAPFLLVGAILFILSDTVLAMGKFHPEVQRGPIVSLIIMGTYIAGQFLLIKGTISNLSISVSKSPN
jgi:uncharacterized membrane protein YhhN